MVVEILQHGKHFAHTCVGYVNRGHPIVNQSVGHIFADCRDRWAHQQSPFKSRRSRRREAASERNGARPDQRFSNSASAVLT